MRFSAALALAVLGASSVSAECRSFKTYCNQGINRYWGTDLKKSIDNIPNNHGAHLLDSDRGYQMGSLRVYSRCLNCKYRAFNDEIKCMAQDILKKCGGGDSFHNEAKAENDWYYVYTPAGA